MKISHLIDFTRVLDLLILSSGNVHISDRDGDGVMQQPRHTKRVYIIPTAALFITENIKVIVVDVITFILFYI